jgi:hypothetical protein
VEDDVGVDESAGKRPEKENKQGDSHPLGLNQFTE